jgi:hypothetical protein
VAADLAPDGEAERGELLQGHAPVTYDGETVSYHGTLS